MSIEPDFDPDTLAWEGMGGLLPAIVQDADAGRVLMLGYMTRTALDTTLATGRVTFHSRSKARLWTKGENSGNYLELAGVVVDCDSDALLVEARPAGPACHTGMATCFGDTPPLDAAFLSTLDLLIAMRKATAPEDSYTARLFARPREKRAQKVGEEGVETALAAMAGDRSRLAEESADLIYHLLVLLAGEDMSLSDVVKVLRERHGARR